MTPADEGTDRWVRDMLDDAVADVEPRLGLDDVRARLEDEARTTRRRTGWGAAAAGLAVAATVATVALATGVGRDTGGNDDGDARPVASPSVGTTEGGEHPDDAAVTPVDGPLPVYYVGDTPTGPRLFREFRAPTSEADDALATAVQMAVETFPDDPDYRTPWPRGTTATAAYDEAGGLLTVDVSSSDMDLRERPRWMDPQDARMALEQLMYTAQAAVQERAPVRFLLEGQVTDLLLGRAASEPLAEGDPMQVQAPVWIITPQEGTAMSTLQVEGRGAFFEANVSWQVLDGDRVVKDGFATAQECCTLAPYAFEVPDLPPGDYVLRVYDADMSGGEGAGEHEDTKSVTISP